MGQYEYVNTKSDFDTSKISFSFISQRRNKALMKFLSFSRDGEEMFKNFQNICDSSKIHHIQFLEQNQGDNNMSDFFQK